MSGRAARLLLLLATTTVAVSALVGLFPSRVPTKRDPGYVDVIFASRVVVLAARLVLLSAALVLLLASIYVAASMVVRIKRREWLRRAGPFESELGWAKDAVGRDVERLVGSLADAWQQIEELGQKLARCGDELDTAYAEVDRLSAEVAELRRSRG